MEARYRIKLEPTGNFIIEKWSIRKVRKLFRTVEEGYWKEVRFLGQSIDLEQARKELKRYRLQEKQEPKYYY